MYREPVTGPRSPRIVYRQSPWLAKMWHAYWAAGSEPSMASKIIMESTFKRLVIWRSVFLFCWNN